MYVGAGVVLLWLSLVTSNKFWCVITHLDEASGTFEISVAYKTPKRKEKNKHALS